MRQTMQSIVTLMTRVSACVLSLARCAGNIELGPDAVKVKAVDGTVDMKEVQAAYIGSGVVAAAFSGFAVFAGSL
jgi:hypothetical protein